MEKIGNWVPQIFYDLIGRILPGGFLLLAAALIFLGPASTRSLFNSTVTTTTTAGATTTETTNAIPSSVWVLAFLAAAYILGSLLSGISAAANRDFWQKPKSNLTNKKDNDISYVYDYIQFHHPEIGARLAKLSAERTMCRVMLVGSVLLAAAYATAAPAGYTNALFWMTEFGLVFLGVCAVCLHRYLSSRSWELMSNNWRLIHEERKQPADAALW